MSGSILRLRAGCFVQMFTVGTILTFEAVWMKSNGLGESTIGMIAGVATFLAFCFGLFWAAVADRTGRAEGMLRTGFFLTAIVIGILPFCTEVNHFLFYAIAGSMVLPLFNALLPHLAVSAVGASPSQGRQFARYRIWGSVGFVFATLVVPRVIPSLPGIFWTASVILILGGCFVTRIQEKPIRLRPQKLKRESLLNTPMVLLLIATASYSMAMPAIFPFLSIHARNLGGDTSFIGLLAASNGILAILSLPLVGRWVDRFGVRLVLLIALATQPVRTFCYSLITVHTWLLLPQLMHILTFACFEIAGVLLVSKLSGLGRGATAQALFLGARTLGFLIGAVVTGFLAESIGYPFAYRIIALMSAIGALAYLPLLRLLGPRGTIASEARIEPQP